MTAHVVPDAETGAPRHFLGHREVRCLRRLSRPAARTPDDSEELGD
jgi:hypothetical protein